MRHIAYAVQWFALALTLADLSGHQSSPRPKRPRPRRAGMIQPSVQDRRQRRLLIGLALLFFAPLALAFYLYYGPGTWHPGGRVNSGDLVRPARPLPELALPLLESGSTAANFLKRKWTLLYVQSGACADSCRMRLYDTRQVRLALDRDMNRVQRVLIAGDGCCDAQFLHEQHPDLIAIRATPAAAPLLALLPDRDQGSAAASPAQAPRVDLIDPLGNLIRRIARRGRVVRAIEQDREPVVLFLQREQSRRERRQPLGLDERLTRKAHESIQALRRDANDRLDRWRRG